MTEPTDAQDPLSALVERCLLRIEDEGSQAVEELCREHPEHATQLRARLQALVQAGFLDFDETPRELPERFGDFVIEGQLGSGGMGVVYLARQRSLDREVALKVVRPEQLFFDKTRDRFQREIDAVARLEHPGIARIFSMGEERGIPYFVMERIAGASLSELIPRLREHPPRTIEGAQLRELLMAKTALAASSTLDSELFEGSWVRCACRIVLQIAQALQHAHERGVLHRDIKPGNVMITPGGRAVLLDFGLAAVEEMHSLTQTGTLLGSVPYMAPEQIAGEDAKIDARTDVYGLGLVLYELLTLQQAFGGGNGEQVRRRILAGELPPPSELNAAIPSDAETICLMAIDRDPERRYADAASFARDLRNFLELRPIAARRPSALHRARQIARRNPARSAALATLLVASLIAALLFAWSERQNSARLRDALDSEKAARLDAEQASQRSSDNFRNATEMVERLLGHFTDSELSLIPAAKSLRRRLLADALALIQELSPEKRDSAMHRVLVASLHARAAVLHTSLAEMSEAQGEIDQAFALLQLAAPGDSSEARRREELARALRIQSLIYGHLRETARSEEAVERAVSLLSAEQRRSEQNTATTISLVEQLDKLANLRRERGEVDSAETLVNKALTLLNGIQEPFPAPALIERARLHSTQARIAHSRRKPAQSYAEFESAARILSSERLRQAELSLSEELLRTRLLGTAYGLLAELERARDRPEDALRFAQLELEHRERLRRQAPNIVGYRSMAASAHARVADMLKACGRLDEAYAALERCCAEFQALLRDHPENRSSRDSAALAFSELGFLSQGAKGEAWLDRSEKLLLELVEQNPAQLSLRDHLGVFLARRARRARGAEDPAAQLDFARRSLELFEQLLAKTGDAQRHGAYAGAVAIELAMAQTQLGDFEPAITTLREARKRYEIPLSELRRKELAPLEGKAGYEALLR
jgi:serine/threonine protein kinase